MKNRGLPLTLVKMGIYGGICANMAEYVQKVAKLCKPGAKLGDPWGSALFVSYRFLPQNSRVLTARRYGGTEFHKSFASWEILRFWSNPGAKRVVWLFFVSIIYTKYSLKSGFRTFQVGWWDGNQKF